jgi:hypothetical protein
VLGLSALARARATIGLGRVAIALGLSALARACPTIRLSRVAIALGLSALACACPAIRRSRVAIEFGSRALAGPFPAILGGSYPVGGSVSPRQRGTVQGLGRSPGTCPRLGRLGGLVALRGGRVSLLGGLVPLLGGGVAVPAGVVALVGGLVSLVGGVVASVASLVAQVGGLVARVAGVVASVASEVAFVGDVVSLLTGMIALLGRMVALLTSMIALLRGAVARFCFRSAPSGLRRIRPTPTDHAQTILDRLTPRALAPQPGARQNTSPLITALKQSDPRPRARTRPQVNGYSASRGEHADPGQTSNAAAPGRRRFEALGCAPGMVECSLPPRDVLHAPLNAHK